MSASATPFDHCGMLADVIVVGLAHRPELLVLAVVVQDEYTHDVIVGEAGGTGRVFVLDCT